MLALSFVDDLMKSEGTWTKWNAERTNWNAERIRSARKALLVPGNIQLYTTICEYCVYTVCRV